MSSMNPQLQQMVVQIQTCNNSQDLSELIGKLKSQASVLEKNITQIDAMLAHLDVNQSTAGYVYLLWKKIQSMGISDNTTVNQICNVLVGLRCEQVKWVGPQLNDIVEQWSLSLLTPQVFNPTMGLELLLRCILNLQGVQLGDDAPAFTSQLTSAHCYFVLCCLKSKSYTFALQLLDVPVLEVPGKEFGVTVKEVLLYFYYGGMVYIGLKQYKRALEFFETCLTVPSKNLSQIQIEAYKKFVLVSLIEEGNERDLSSKLTSPVVSRTVSRTCSEYSDLKQAFKAGKDQLKLVLKKNKDVYQRDSNYGLAKQTLSALVRKKIQLLTNTYVTVPLSEIAEAVDLKDIDQAEDYVVNMIGQGDIHAKIDEKKQVISFHDDPELYMSSDMAEQLHEKIKTAAELKARLQSAHFRIQSNQYFINKHGKQPTNPMDKDWERDMYGPDDDVMDHVMKFSMNDY